MNTFRIGLHLLAATVWVGGQIVMAGLVPSLRALGPDAPGKVAQRFNQIAWPAYFLLLMTGVWSLLAVDDIRFSLFAIKFLMFVISGIGAGMHIMARGRKALLAVGGALASVGAVAALFLGVALAPHGIG